MKPSHVAGLLLLVLGLNSVVAATLSAPMTRRESNRQVILAELGADYQPLAPVQYLRGTPYMLDTNKQTTAADALELQLDFLDAQSLWLPSANPPAQNDSQPPKWPLQGEIAFHESGFRNKGVGASCPTVKAETPEALNQIFNTTLTGKDIRLGTLTTNVSFYTVNDRHQQIKGRIQYWMQGHDRTTQPIADNRWYYTNWTVEAAYYIEYSCVLPKAEKGWVQHDSFVIPYANRTNQPR
jgi:hypothetical protein